MTTDMMDFRSLAGKSADVDLLREMIGFGKRQKMAGYILFPTSRKRKKKRDLMLRGMKGI